MNDFTKEELQYIAEAIEMWFKDYDSETPERIYLKVKAMIDNYCNHDWNFPEVIKKIVLNPGVAFPVECNKCGSPLKGQ